MACVSHAQLEPPEATEIVLKASPSYQADIAPIFENYCVKCHNESDAHGGLRMDNYGDLMKGGQDGPVIIPGDPKGSLLVKLVESLTEPAMPFHGQKLTLNRINDISNWIRQGAQNN